jgi:hypothetical protein
MQSSPQFQEKCRCGRKHFAAFASFRDICRALLSGIDRYYGDKNFTLKVIAKYNKETDPDALDRSYEFYRRAGFRRELTIPEPGCQGVLDFLFETIREAKKAKPAQFFDDRLVKELDAGK